MTRVGQVYRDNLVKNLTDGIGKHSNIFVLTYTALSGAKLNSLRKSLQQSGADMVVSKNSLARITLKNAKQDVLANRISGQTAFVWSNADSVSVSKILVKFAKDFDTITLQGGLLDGLLLEKEDVKKLSDLPSREVLLAQLLGTIQAPVTRLLYVFNAKSQELLSILKQYGESKGSGSSGSKE